MSSMSNIIGCLRLGNWGLVLHTTQTQDRGETPDEAIERLVFSPDKGNLISVLSEYKSRGVVRPDAISASKSVEVTALDRWYRHTHETWDLALSLTGCELGTQGFVDFLDSVITATRGTILQVYTSTSVRPVLAYGKCDYFEDVLAVRPFCWCRNEKYPAPVEAIKHSEVWNTFVKSTSIVFSEEFRGLTDAVPWESLSRS